VRLENMIGQFNVCERENFVKLDFGLFGCDEGGWKF
jgi:hypothetical protein